MKSLIYKGLFTALSIGFIGVAVSDGVFADDNYTIISQSKMETEKTKALKSGFTEEQFNQIMNIPQLTQYSENSGENRSLLSMTSNQTKIINMALKQIGKPYVWGAYGPDSFDCGGLVKYVYGEAMNITLPMGTTNQETYGKNVSLDALQPGDLLFYGDAGSTYHVGIYKGNGIMIHAPKPGETVKEVNIQYFYPSFAKRILDDEPESEYSSVEYNKIVTATKAWSIWDNLQFSNELKKVTIGENFKIGKIYTNLKTSTRYGEVIINNKVYGYINFDAVKELTSTQINKYLTAKESGQAIWGNLTCTSSRGKTEKNKIYFVKGAYNLGDGKYLYSVYKDQDSSEWIGYVKADTSLSYTKVEDISKNITVDKNSSIWSNLQLETEVESALPGSVFSAKLKLTNVSNGEVYYKIYKNTGFYGYINVSDTVDLTHNSVNKYVTFSKDGDNFWTSLYTNVSKGKTERGRVFYITIQYITGNNQPIYSVYTDETAKEWLGYYNGNNFVDTEVTILNNKTATIVKDGVTIWSDLNFSGKNGKTVLGQTFEVNRKFYNNTNNSSYYELLKDGKIYGYINTSGAKI